MIKKTMLPRFRPLLILNGFKIASFDQKKIMISLDIAISGRIINLQILAGSENSNKRSGKKFCVMDFF